jgi:allantoicase
MPLPYLRQFHAHCAPAKGRTAALGRHQTNSFGWEADRRFRMRNAEWLTLTLIEATLVEATLVGITHRLRRFANVR